MDTTCENNDRRGLVGQLVRICFAMSYLLGCVPPDPSTNNGMCSLDDQLQLINPIIPSVNKFLLTLANTSLPLPESGIDRPPSIKVTKIIRHNNNYDNVKSDKTT